MIKNITKKIAGLILGTAMILGVGVGLGSTHGEAVGVRAADEVTTFKAGTDTSSSSSLTKNGITITMSTMNRDDNYRANSGTSLKVASSNGNIIKAEFTCTASDTNNYGPGKMKGDNYSYSGKIGTWALSTGATSFTLSTTAQVRMIQIAVTVRKVAAVTGITISPSDDVSLAVGKSKTFTVSIIGDNLTEDEEVDLSFSEGGDGLNLSATKAKNNSEIEVTATKADVIDELIATYGTISSNKITITTEEAKTPTRLEYDGTPITSYVAGQSFDPTDLTFKVFYGDEDTTGSEVDVEHITFSPSTLLVDTTSVAGSYTENNVTVSFSISGITVEADYIVDVEFDTSSAKTEYNIGETWVNKETGVFGIGSYKVSTEDMLEIYAKDFTYSGYDSTKGGKQTITVSYPNPKSETPFSTTYTVNVKSETLKQLESEGDGNYYLVTDYSTLSAGNKIVIAQNEKGKTAGDFESGKVFLSSVTTTFSSDKSKISSLGEGTVVFTLAGSSSAWSLLNDEGNRLGAYGSGKLTWDSTAENFNGNWTFKETTDSDQSGVEVQNGKESFGRFLYNNGSPRFTTYTSASSTSMLVPQIYKLSDNIYKIHEASLSLVNTVKSIYNDGYLSCDTNGANSTIKWTEITNLFSSNVTDADELEFLKEALSDETAANGTIKKFLADYDYILCKYNSAPYSKGYVDFLERNPTSSASSISRISYVNDNNTAILIVVLVAFTSVTVIGGILIIRKGKAE